MAQTIGALAILAAAVAYLTWRYLTKRATGNCCGEKECPAVAQMLDRIRQKAR